MRPRQSRFQKFSSKVVIKRGLFTLYEFPFCDILDDQKQTVGNS